MEDNQATSSPAPETSAPLSLSEAFSSNGSTGNGESGTEFRFKEEPIEQTPAAAASTTGDVPAGEAEKATVTDTTAVVQDDSEFPAELAAEYSLDPQNPAHRKVLAVLAKQNAQTSTEADTADVLELTEFERQHLEPAPPADTPDPTKTDSTAAAGEKPLEPGKFGDIGDAWETPADALQQESDEWAKDTPDLKKIAEIRAANFRRQLAGHQGMVQFMIAQVLKSELGDLPQQMKASQQRQRSDNNYNFALAELSKAKGFEDVPKLFERQGDAKVKFKGVEYPDTPANRILAENPEILDIQVKHADPDTAERLTEMARLRHMHKLHRLKQQAKKSLPADKAAAIFDSGQQAATKNPADRTRQSFNAGRGASGNGDTSDPNSWLKTGANPDAVSVSDLLRK